MRRFHLLIVALLLGVLVAMTAATPAAGAPKDAVEWTLTCDSGQIITVRGGGSWTFRDVEGTARFVAHTVLVDAWDDPVADRAHGREGETCTTRCPYTQLDMTLRGTWTPVGGR
jgi:hypothetical protein